MKILNKICNIFSFEAEVKNYLVNKAMQNPIHANTSEYSMVIRDISKELSLGKTVKTIIDGELVTLKYENNQIIQFKQILT